MAVSPRALRRALMWLSVITLLVSVAPLYGMAMYAHPYYDDYRFAAEVHHAWQQTGQLHEALNAALENSREIYQTWQGTYTGTFLSNIQPGVFSESLYWVGCVFLLTTFLAGFGYFYLTAFHALGLDKAERATLTCLALTVTVQLLPDVGEAFYWFNGGVGNTFIYAMLALSLGLCLRMLNASRRGAVTRMLALLPLMVLLGGGSYGGGLFGLLLYGLWTLALVVRRHPRWWCVALLLAVFAAGFVYSMAAPGNVARAMEINGVLSVPQAIFQSLYYGTALMGSYLRLPLIAVTLVVLPWLYRAARESRYAFSHPWLCLALMAGLFCAQLTPPLYSGVFIGGGRIRDTYYQSFVCMWLLYCYYLAGFAARRMERGSEWKPLLTRFDAAAHGKLALFAACLLAVGCLGWKLPDDTYFGAQNMNGVSAALSLATGEAARYHQEMCAREALLNDESQPEVTLAPLTAMPRVFMDDLLAPGAAYDTRPALCMYYGKAAIHIGGEVSAP